MSTEAPPATPDEVRAFLLEEDEALPPIEETPAPEMEDLDLQEEVLAQTLKGGEAEREQREDQRPDPDFPESVGGALDQMGAGGISPEMQLAEVFSRILEVPAHRLLPTETEKDLFTSALETHQPVQFGVELGVFRNKQAPVLRCLTARERRLVFRTTDLVTAENSAKILQPSAVWYDLLSRLSLAYQLISWPGLQLPGLGADKTQPDDELVVKQLMEYADTHLRDLPDPTWRLMLTALRIFESKMNTLQALALQPSFYSPDEGASA